MCTVAACDRSAASAPQAVRFSAEPLSGGAPAASPGRVTLTRRHGPVSSCHVPAAPAGAAHRLLLVGEDDTVTMARIGGQSDGTRECRGWASWNRGLCGDAARPVVMGDCGMAQRAQL